MPPVPTGPPSEAELRTRAAAGAVGLVIAATIVLVVLVGGASVEQPPATGAATLVPSDALAYVNVSMDPHRAGVRRALTLAAKLPSYPLLSAALQNRLDGLAASSGAQGFNTDIRPWLGNEAALALLNTQGSTAGSLIVLDVRDSARARSFLTSAGASPAGSYRGTTLSRYPGGTELAFVSHYLVLGQDASVRAAIDVASGVTKSLDSSSSYQAAAAGQPAGRVLDAYVSAAGVRRLLMPQGGLIGALGALLYQPALTGVSVSLAAASAAANVRVHSALDPHLAQVGGGNRKPFTPSLEGEVPSGSMLLLDVTGLDAVAPHVLNAGASGGIAGQIGPLLSRLGAALRAEGVNVADLVSIFHGETAVAIAPSAPGAGAAARRPALTIVARTKDEARTRSELAELELPLEQLFPPPNSGAGAAPLFNDRQVGSTTIHQLSLAPGLEFDYAVTHGLVILSTSLGAAAQVASHAHSLTHDAAYQRAFTTRPDQVTSLLFLDFNQLLNLGEQTGLTRSARLRALRPDLQKIRTVGLYSTSGEADSTAELFLQIP